MSTHFLNLEFVFDPCEPQELQIAFCKPKTFNEIQASTASCIQILKTLNKTLPNSSTALRMEASLS